MLAAYEINETFMRIYVYAMFREIFVIGKDCLLNEQ